MAMRLLSAPQGKSQRQLDNSALELRSIELNGLIAKKRKELNDLDLKVLAHASATEIVEERLLQEQLRALKEEVTNLETRKKLALVPLEQKEKEIDTTIEALAKREETISIKETDISQTIELLQDRLDTVSEREQNALIYSADLEARNSNLSIKETEQKKKEDAVLAILKESAQQKLLDEQETAKQKAILKGRDTVLNERERIVSKKEKSFANREKAILDRYKTLEMAILEMKLKHGDKLKVNL